MSNPWLIGALAYAVGSLAIGLLVYAAFPIVVRSLLRSAVQTTCAALEGEAAQRRDALLERGQHYALAGPQAAIIGHLVEPHLRKFAGWLAEQWSSSTSTFEDTGRLEACWRLWAPRRAPLALAISQGSMALIAVGYLLRSAVGGF